MRTISEETIEAFWERQCEMNEEDARVLMERFSEEQPALVAHLMVADENLGEDADESQLLPLAALVWETMSAEHGPLVRVEPETVEGLEESNIALLEEMDEDSEIGRAETVKRLFLDFNQRPLLQFVLEVLMSGNEDTPELAPERIGFELLHLKTMIDCLDQ